MALNPEGGMTFGTQPVQRPERTTLAAAIPRRFAAEVTLLTTSSTSTYSTDPLDNIAIRPETFNAPAGWRARAAA
jgi:hypothetical protein